MELRNAIQQVEDWQRYIKNYIHSVRVDLPGISDPQGLIILGRKASINEKDLERLIQSNETNRAKYEIMTYDDLIDRAKTLLNNITITQRSLVSSVCDPS